MGEKRKRVEIENGHDEVYPLHNEALTRNGSTNNRTVVTFFISSSFPTAVFGLPYGPPPYGTTSTVVVAVRPKTSGLYISSARAGATTKVPRVVALAT